MYCKNCGTKLADNAKFCDKCGIAVSEDKVNLTKEENKQNNQHNQHTSGYVPPFNGQYSQYAPPRRMREDELGIIALCLGIGSVLMVFSFIFTWAAIFPAIAAIVIGIIKLRKKNGGKGMAIGAIVSGAISTILVIIGVVIFVLLIVYADKNDNKTYSFDYGNSGKHYNYNYNNDENNQDDDYDDDYNSNNYNSNDYNSNDYYSNDYNRSSDL